MWLKSLLYLNNLSKRYVENVYEFIKFYLCDYLQLNIYIVMNKYTHKQINNKRLI